jgi:hypothetical protein
MRQREAGRGSLSHENPFTWSDARLVQGHTGCERVREKREGGGEGERREERRKRT